MIFKTGVFVARRAANHGVMAVFARPVQDEHRNAYEKLDRRTRMRSDTRELDRIRLLFAYGLWRARIRTALSNSDGSPVTVYYQ